MQLQTLGQAAPGVKAASLLQDNAKYPYYEDQMQDLGGASNQLSYEPKSLEMRASQPAHAFSPHLPVLQSRVEALEDKFQKLEKLNQTVLQDNYDLKQELMQTKESYHTLERFFKMLMNQFGSGQNQDRLRQIITQFMKPQMLVAPPVEDIDEAPRDQFVQKYDVEPKIMKRVMQKSMIDQLSMSSDKNLEEMSMRSDDKGLSPHGAQMQEYRLKSQPTLDARHASLVNNDGSNPSEARHTGPD